MTNTTQKFRRFVDEPMGEKDVSALPGIGNTFASVFKENGFNMAHQVLGQYLVFDKDENRFKDWLKATFRNMNARHMDSLYQSLREHCGNYVQ